MKYTIKIDNDNNILAVSRWKPAIVKKKKKVYNIPKGLELISEKKYKEITSLSNLDLFLWVDGNLVKKDPSIEEANKKLAKETLDKYKKTQFKELLKSLEGYVVLTDKGKKFIS